MIRITKPEAVPEKDLTTFFCGFLTAISGAVPLIGWIAGVPALTRILSHYIPMAPDTAFLFILTGAVLMFGMYVNPSRAKQRSLGILFVAIAIYGTIKFLRLFIIFEITPIGINDFIREFAPFISDLNPGMSPFTGGLFTLGKLVSPDENIQQQPSCKT